MTRDRALEISDVLTERGIGHTIVVGVADGYHPRERYTVNVTPVLTYAPTDITALQRIADSLRSSIAYINGSFMFTDAGAAQ